MDNSGRWENYFLKKGKDFKGFWKNYLISSARDILFIGGVGFDPRTSLNLIEIFDSDGKGKRDFKLLYYFKNKDKEKGKYTSRTERNKTNIYKFIEQIKGHSITDYHLIEKNEENKSVISRNSIKIISEAEIKMYTDIIVDISAMPKLVFFPLINKLLSVIDDTKNKIINLHIVVCENFYLDSIIKDVGLEEDAFYTHGFGNLDLGINQGFPKIWMPILGENQEIQLEILQRFLNPVDVSPILPFPSRLVKRGDELLMLNKKLFFDTLKIEPKNIIYVDEKNPFHVYRFLNQSIKKYTQSYNLMGGCKIIVSALSSKLLSIGALLSVYENRNSIPKKYVGIAHVEADSHNIVGGESRLNDYSNENELFELWLTGEPYCE